MSGAGVKDPSLCKMVLCGNRVWPEGDDGLCVTCAGWKRRLDEARVQAAYVVTNDANIRVTLCADKRTAAAAAAKQGGFIESCQPIHSDPSDFSDPSTREL